MKKLGFGCMRLPMTEDGQAVDYAHFSKMIDTYMAAGYNYFDTAHGYISGKSETAIRECLVARYPREAYELTDKLTSQFFSKEEEIRPFFEKQLECTGVSWFDTYLMHALNEEYYEKFMACNAFDVVRQLKDEGKIRAMGISFHDKSALLDRILTEHPDIEVVQIQFNYADYEDPGIEGRRCYEVCRKHGKPVIIMEPLKGGGLVNLPPEAARILDTHRGDKSYASYALRYCASFEGVVSVLSGMSTLEQVEDNLRSMENFQPFTEEEFRLVGEVRKVLMAQDTIPCTACRYCVDDCPKAIPIPELFSDYNAKQVFQDWNSDWYYSIHTQGRGKAGDCIQCGLCEKSCPQHIAVMRELETVSGLFDKK